MMSNELSKARKEKQFLGNRWKMSSKFKENELDYRKS